MFERAGGWISGFGGIGIGMAVATFALQANPQERALDANLYMQTSAEYRAVCLQTYNWATERLIERLGTMPAGVKPPAVIMDLDETVVDNSAFQSYLDREKATYSDAAWEKYESGFPNEVRLIPGAKGFIQEAERRGVTVVYISNRLAKYSPATGEALRLNGINTSDLSSRMVLKTDTSDKTVRRTEVGKNYTVVMLVGDNLRDFSESFVTPKLDFTKAEDRASAINTRYAETDKNAFRWGSDWIILPNPAYGEWQKPLGKEPRLNLRPTQIK